MLRILFITLFIFISFHPCFSQNINSSQQDSLKAVVIKVFTALAELDTSKARQYCTSDVSILESSQVWNFDSLALRISTRKAKSPDFKRVNTFEFIETKVFESVGYVSYFNYATISFGGKTTKVKWIETAVMRKEQGGWKMALLHSTELERNTN